METYNVNGVKFEYDTFDLVNMEIRHAEAQRVFDAVQKYESLVNSDQPYDTQFAGLRAVCEVILDAFDTILGEGSAAKIFGGRINVMLVPAVFKQFAEDVDETVKSFARGQAAPAAPVNQTDAQKAAAREKRREAARLRVEAGSGKKPI